MKKLYYSLAVYTIHLMLCISVTHAMEEPEECKICAISNIDEDQWIICDSCGQKWCDECNQQMSKMSEQQDSSGAAHPNCIGYANDPSPEELDKTIRYEKATPEREPTWLWFRIAGANYFLEERTLWRYLKDEADEPYLMKYWRWIIPLRCPFCKTIPLGELENQLLAPSPVACENPLTNTPYRVVWKTKDEHQS